MFSWVSVVLLLFWASVIITRILQSNLPISRLVYMWGLFHIRLTYIPDSLFSDSWIRNFFMSENLNFSFPASQQVYHKMSKLNIRVLNWNWSSRNFAIQGKVELASLGRLTRRDKELCFGIQHVLYSDKDMTWGTEIVFSVSVLREMMSFPENPVYSTCPWPGGYLP